MRLRNIFFAWTLFLSGCPWMKRDTIIKEPEAEQQVVLEQPANPDQASNPIIQHEPLTEYGSFSLVNLYGTHYDMGFQHGKLLENKIKKVIKKVRTNIKKLISIPLVSDYVINNKLDSIYDASDHFLPLEYKEELQGIADGAKISVNDLEQLIAVSMLSDSSCSGFAAYKSATLGGNLIQLRNLDWNTDWGLQEEAVVFVYHPDKKNSYVSVGFAGFPGVLTGINTKGISLTEIGSASVDKSFEGSPMPFLLKKVLEESSSLDEVIDIVSSAKRTGGFNYVFGSAFESNGVAVETTRSLLAVYFRDKTEPKLEYEFVFPDIVFRADTAFNPEIRDKQTCSNGNPEIKGLESPVGSEAYDIRYVKQAEYFKKYHGKLNIEIAKAIAKAIAPESNIHSVIYAWPELYISVASLTERAAYRDYEKLNLDDLFE